MNKTSRLLVFIFAALSLFPACGRKGNLIIPGMVLPQAPSGVSAESRGDGIIISWTMPEKNTAHEILTNLAGFKVLRAELPAGQEICPCQFEPVKYIDLELPEGAVIKDKRVAWLDPAPGLVMGKRYIYKVVGVNKDGYPGIESASVIVRPLAPPEVPAGLTATPGKKRVLLEWKPVDKDVLGEGITDLAGYDIYRSKDPKVFPGGPVNPKPLQGATFEDTGLLNNTAYYYRVSALRGKEPPFTEGEASGTVSATPADIEPPAAPAGLRAVPGDGYVLLSWDPNTEEDLAGYYVYRKGPGETGFKRLNERLTDRITYKDADVVSGSEYTYAVTAVDNAVPPNESGHSAEAVVDAP